MRLLFRALPRFRRLSKRGLTSEITPEEPSQLYSLLTPFIDYTEMDLKSPYLKSNLEARGLKADVAGLSELWLTYQHIVDVVASIEKFKGNISKAIKESKDEEKIQLLKNKGKTMREDVKAMQEGLKTLELILFPSLLQLPNDLSEKCSSDGSIIEEFGERKPGVNHLNDSENLYFVNPQTYYLKNDAFLFERELLKSCSKNFLNHGFIPTSNPHFSRGLITKDGDDGISIELKTGDSFNGLFLSGGASINSFCAMHAKKIVNRTDLPIKYVTEGTYYKPKESALEGLYGAWQSKGTRVFIVSEKDTEDHFDEVLQTTIAWYKKLNLPFRAIYTPIKLMKHSEKLRASFQAFSPFHNDYVEVGHLSYYSSFLSKRLRMYYKSDDDVGFLNCTSGLIVDTAPLIACLLENKRDLKAFRSSLNTS